MKIKRIVAVLLAVVLLLSMTGCKLKKRYKHEVDGMTTYFFGDKKDMKDFPEVADTLNPEQIYAALEYNEKMLYGRYSFDGDEEDYLDKVSFAPMDHVEYEGEAETTVLSNLPIAMDAGAVNSIYGQRNHEHEWAELSFVNENGYIDDAICTYTVSGNTVTFTPVSYYEVLYEEYLNEDNQTSYRSTGLKYELGTTAITYTFSFRGPDLTLSNGTQSVTLRAREFMDSVDEPSPSLYGRRDANSPAVEGIDTVSCTIYNFSFFDQSSYVYYMDSKEYGDEGFLYRNHEMATYREDGLLTLVWTQDDGDGNPVQKIRQFVAFVGGLGSLILVDNESVYYYTQSDESYLLDTVSQGMTDEERMALEEMEEAEIQEIVQKKADLLKDLGEAFIEAGLSVQINETTGEIALDSTVLFDVDKAVISAEGKELLAQFMQVYTSVVFNEKYSGFVSRILVEGHTDTSGTYERNQVLSQERADAVRDFCLSTDAGVDAVYQPALTDSLSAMGYASDYPVYAQDGSVDMDASRRVSFRFVINLNS